MINAERAAGLRRLFRYKLTHYPLQTLRLLRRFLRYMPLRDVRVPDRQAVPRATSAGRRRTRSCRAPSSTARSRTPRRELTQVSDADLERVMQRVAGRTPAHSAGSGTGGVGDSCSLADHQAYLGTPGPGETGGRGYREGIGIAGRHAKSE